MTRASLITLLATFVLSSFAGATQNSGKVWWPQFRGPSSTGLGEGKPPVNFGPDLNVNQQWERRLPMPENPYGAVASPIVAGDLLVLNHQGKDAYLLAVNRRDGRTVWKTDRSMFQYGWSTPVHWRHDGIDEIVVLGGDFKPNQRLMAYSLSDGAERWWVGGLPPCGKSTPVVGDGLLYLAAPDIILEPAAEKRNPERAAQIYANNAARVMAIRPGGTGELSQEKIAWSERRGVPGVPSTTTGAFIRSRTAGSFSVESQRPASCCTANGWGFRATTTPRRGCRPQDLHCIRRG